MFEYPLTCPGSARAERHHSPIPPVSSWAGSARRRGDVDRSLSWELVLPVNCSASPPAPSPPRYADRAVRIAATRRTSVMA